MALYDILKDRSTVNALKMLYEHAVIQKKGHTIKLKDLNNQLPSPIGLHHITLLDKHDLIQQDTTDEDVILSISMKGREFIEAFDSLVELMHGKKEQKSNAKIEYHLTEVEKRILVMILRIGNEIGKDNVTLKQLTRELFPTEIYERKSATVSKQTKRLEDISLTKRTRKGREVIILLTEKGNKIIKDQFLQGIIR